MASLIFLIFAVVFARRIDHLSEDPKTCSSYRCMNITEPYMFDTCQMNGKTYKDKDGNKHQIIEINPCSSVEEQCNLPNTVLNPTGNSTCGGLQDRYGDETCVDYDKTSSSCVYNLACASGKCKTTGSCKTTEQCGLNEFCDGSKCTALLQEGDACSDEYSCAFPYGCNLSTKKCTKYFSLPSGSAVDCDTTTNTNYLCSSASCGNNECTSSALQSTKSSAKSVPQLDDLRARNCTGNSGTTCPIYNQDDLSTDCTCGYNFNATAHCGMLPGDWPYSELVSFYKEWVDNSESYINTKCHTLRRFEPECIFGVNQPWLSKQKQTYNDIAAYYFLTRDFVAIQANNECTEAAINNDYFNATYYYTLEHSELITEEHDTSFAWTLTALIVALVA